MVMSTIEVIIDKENIKRLESAPVNNRYKAYWCKNKYYAVDLELRLHCDGSDVPMMFTTWTDSNNNTWMKSSCTTLETVINQASHILSACRCGYIEVFDGKYRIATITKKYNENDTENNYTTYGRKCWRCEDV